MLLRRLRLCCAALPRDCVTACMWVTGLAGPGPGVISTVSSLHPAHLHHHHHGPRADGVVLLVESRGKELWLVRGGRARPGRRHSADFSHESCVQYLRTGLQRPHRATAGQYRAHTYLTLPRPTRPADTSAGAKQYFVFAIKYFLMALNKNAPCPMSVSIPGWCGPGGAAGRAVTQIRARVRRPGRRGPQLRPARPPAGQLRSGLSQQSHTSSHFYFSSFILVHAHSPTLGPRPDVTQGWSSPCSLPWR